MVNLEANTKVYISAAGQGTAIGRWPRDGTDPNVGGRKLLVFMRRPGARKLRLAYHQFRSLRMVAVEMIRRHGFDMSRLLPHRGHIGG